MHWKLLNNGRERVRRVTKGLDWLKYNILFTAEISQQNPFEQWIHT
jgi:hypothetical protein